MATNRYFLDRDLGKRLSRALRAVDIDVVPHYERFGERAVPDEEWIPVVTSEGMVIVSHNHKIRSQPDERAVFEAARARCFFLTIKDATPLLNLRAIMIAWDAIERLSGHESPPFMYGLSREGRLTPYLVGGTLPDRVRRRTRNT